MDAVGVVVIRVDIGRLREPAAWIMLAMVSTGVLIGIARLLISEASPIGGSGTSFGIRAASGLYSLASPVSTALAVAAVFLVTKVGEPTPRARQIVLGMAGALGLAVLFSLISALGLLFGGALSFRDRFEYLLTGLPMVALTALGAVFTLNSVAAWEPRRERGRADGGFFGGFQNDAHAGYGQQSPPASGPAPAHVGPVQASAAPHAPVIGGPYAHPPGLLPHGSQPPVGQPLPAQPSASQPPVLLPRAPQPAGSQPPVVQPLNAQPLGPQASYPEQPFREPSYQEPQQANQYASPYAAQSHGPEPVGASAPYAVQQPEVPRLPQSADQPFVQPIGGYAEPFGGPVFDQHGYAGQQFEAVGHGHQPDAVGHGQPSFVGQPESPAFEGSNTPEEAPAFAQHSFADPAAAQLSYAGPAVGGQAFADPAAPHHAFDPAAPQHTYAEPAAAHVSYVEPPVPQLSYAGPVAGGQAFVEQGVGQPAVVQHSYMDPALAQESPAQFSYPEPSAAEAPVTQAPYAEPTVVGQPYAEPAYAEPAYAKPGFGHSRADHGQYSPAEQAQPYGQPQGQPYGQPQGGSPFSGYSGPQFTPHVAEQPPSFEAGFEPVSVVDGQVRAFDGVIDPREQQLAQAYQQAQGYQQHAQPVVQATGPLPKIPDYYSSPLGHPQGPEPTTYADQTLRFDPHQGDPHQGDPYEGDALSGPYRREEPINPTAIYAPERSPVKHEEGVGTEQVGHATDSTLHWYGSDR